MAAAPANVAAGAPRSIDTSKKEGGGKTGLVLVIGGLAAAAAIAFAVTSGSKSEPTAAVAQKTESTQTPASTTAPEPAKPEVTAQVVETAKPDDGAIDIASLTDASANPEASAGSPLAPGSTALALNDATGPAGPKKPEKIEPNGTLDEAMKTAAGTDGKSKASEAQPAAEETRPKNVPDLPSQGVVTSALGKVRGAAKACVAGADEPSTASITFGSSGAVQSVSVSGWAAGKGAASCIKSAVQAANVGPFSKPSYSAPLTIRP